MPQQLTGKRVAIVVADGFEQDELEKPRQALEEAGAKTEVISPKAGKVKGWKYTDWGTEIAVDEELRHADPNEYDALMLPGGQMNPDNLCMDTCAVRFIESFVRTGKPIAAICHGPLTSIEANGVRGRRMTSFPSIKTDLKNAGADWVDQEVVTDQGLVTSRKPDDIPAFNRKIIEEFAEGRHPGRLRSFTPATGSGKAATVEEGTFAGPKEKSPRQNLGSQGRGQN
ncbi:MAG TPA: type 1 glutamine amidotransferase domain-containing protein [Chthoniobacterales bacterium]|nr:type 1 glutamine amidotransferase domain-containing protein [Chthoniobacterales bacterium]